MPPRCGIARRTGLAASLLILTNLSSFLSVSGQRLRSTRTDPDDDDAPFLIKGLERQLAVISSTLPTTDISLSINYGSSPTTETASAGGTASIPAGESLSSLEVTLTSGSDTFSGAGNIRVVLGTVTDSEADSGACTDSSTSLGLESVSGNLAGSSGASTSLTNSDATLDASLGTASFKQGGSFQLCYSDDGTYGIGHASLLDIELDVSGVSWDCTGDDCLADREYYCFALKGVQGEKSSCSIAYDAITGNTGKATWTEAFTSTFSSGVESGLTAKSCGTTPDTTVMCPVPLSSTSVCEGAATPVYYIDPDSTQSNLVVDWPQLKPLTSVTEGYTVAACYCPDIDSCDSDAEFTQQVGVIYIFAAKVCDPLYLSTCATDSGFYGVAGTEKFAIAMHCPPGGCAANDNSRIKLVDSSSDNDKPSWDTSRGCMTATQTEWQYAPDNCDSATSCSLTGGSRQDYKIFGSAEEPFKLWKERTEASDYESRNFDSSDKYLDICYCLGSCDTAANWFKAGQIGHTPFRLVDVSVLGGTQAEVLSVAGNFGLYHPGGADALGLAAGGVLKFVTDDERSVTDTGCQTAEYTQPTGVGGYEDYVSVFNGQVYDPIVRRMTEDSRRMQSDDKNLVFNSGTTTNMMTFSKAGIYAICYCHLSDCEEISSSWVLAARYTIRGPIAEELSWTVSTGVLFELSYSGYDIRETDMLRIIPSTGTCTANTQNPANDGSIQLGCPDNCQTVDAAAGGSFNLATTLLKHDEVRCNVRRTICDTVYIRKIEITGADTTDIEFDGIPGLSSGDRIVLGSNIECDDDCTEDTFATLSGVHSFANGGTYHVGILLTATTDANRFQANIGWSSLSMPTFTVTDGQGQWTRISKGTTKQELQAEEAKVNMKVCWGHAGEGSYSTQIGVMAVVLPPTMSLWVALTSTVIGQVAPMVVSFGTGDIDEYESATNELMLKIEFIDLSHLEPRLTDGSQAKLPSGASSNDLKSMASSWPSRETCSRLFLELWSDDSAGGFPQPTGCVLEETLNGIGLIVYVRFEAQQGLRKSTNYQMVINAKVKTSSVTDIIRITATDDIVEKPYEVLERAAASTSLAATDRSTEANPRFAPTDGLVLIADGEALLDLSGDELDFTFLLGGDETGPIVKQTVLKLFMYPLTLWDLDNSIAGGTSCDATCTAAEGLSCTGTFTCSVSAVVDGKQVNTIDLELPGEMDSISGASRNTIRVKSLVLPDTGFFPTRFAGQLSKSDGSSPDYQVASGAYMWMPLSASSTIAELVTKEGDGNEKPFTQNAQNILHLHLVFGATIFANSVSMSNLTVTLPKGYSAAGVVATTSDLGIFDTTPAIRKGQFDLSKWTCSSNACHYHIEAYERLWAGTHFFLSLEVTNPSSVMPRSSSANVWKLNITCPGESSIPQTPESKIFAGSSHSGTNDFGGNVPVMGQLGTVVIQPSVLSAGSASVLSVFFETQQTTGAEGFILVDAPMGFEFGSSCIVTDLSEESYGSLTGDGSYALPEVSTCTGSTLDSSSTRNRATIQLVGALQANRVYAFALEVTNPSSFSEEQLSGWSVWTQDSSGYFVDGSLSASFTGLDTDTVGFAVYEDELGEAYMPDFTVSSWRPYSLTSQYAEIVVFPIKVPNTVTSSLRVIAPKGFVWTWSTGEFYYMASTSTTDASQIISGATADLPGGEPTSRDSNVLSWDPQEYVEGEEYGFAAKLIVPDHTSLRATNSFFIEFGHQELSNGTERWFAARTAATRVPALGAVNVEYSSSVAGEANSLTFTVRVTTTIPQGGALVISGPEGFSVPDLCQPLPVVATDEETAQVKALGEASMLPSSSFCSFHIGDTDSSSQIWIQAGEGGISSGLYRFSLLATNPSESSPLLTSEQTACSYTRCWTFSSLEDAFQGIESTALDVAASIPGFAIKNAMAYAGFVELDVDTLEALGRDDRPNMANRVTIGFRLSARSDEEQALVLTAPAGFEFNEDCLADVTTEGVSTTFGSSVASVMALHGTWEDGVAVASCKGGENTATMQIGSGLAAKTSYLFSILLKSNPAKTPRSNRWHLATSKESSASFEGFALKSFTQLKLTPLTNASGVQGLVNISFRPLTTIPLAGSLLVTLPTGFSAVRTAGSCPSLLEERNPIETALSSTSTVTNFSSSDVDCTGKTNSNVVAVTFGGSRQMMAGRDYVLILTVTNPSTPTAASDWTIQSYEDTDFTSPLDVATLPGYEVVTAMGWTYQEESTFTANGGASLADALTFSLTLPLNLIPDQQIVVSAPPGFILASASSKPGEELCDTLTWVTEFSGLSATCTSNSMVLTTSDIVYNSTTLQFQVVTSNPSISPVWPLNYWRTSHFDSEGDLLAAGLFGGWRVVPQLSSVSVDMTSSGFAGSSATLVFSFVPLSDATTLTIQAKTPAGFDFSLCSVGTVNLEIVEALDEEITLKISMVSGNAVSLTLMKVELPPNGGASTFDLATYDADGVLADRMLSATGFRVPVGVTVKDPVLTTVAQSQPLLYPVKSNWKPQLGSAATATFTLTATDAIADKVFTITAPGFTLSSSGLAITYGSTTIPTTVISTSDSTLQAKLGGTLQAGVVYTLKVSVVAPASAADVTDEDWEIVFTDGGHLPFANMAGITTSFTFVEPYTVSISVGRSPPVTDLEVTLSASLGSTAPTALNLIAPTGFVFSTACLANDGDIVQSCSKTTVSSRPAVRLVLSSAATGSISGIKVRVTSPSKTPTSTRWLLEGLESSTGQQLGWGEDADGFEVDQMQQSELTFAAATGVTTPLAVRFRTTEAIGGGGRVQLMKPSTMTLSCASEDIALFGLPAMVECSVNSTSFLMTLNGTLAPGEYAFTVAATTPASTPSSNIFSILLRDKYLSIQDAAMNIAGPSLLTSPKVSSPSLAVTSTTAGQASTATLSFSVLQAIAAQTIGSLIITLPTNFEHDVSAESDLAMGTLELPTATSSALTFSTVDELQLALDMTQEIPAGDYTLTFPIVVPETAPTYNIWSVAFCSSSTCSTDSALLIAPIPGFTISTTSTGSTSANALRHTSPHVTIALGLVASMFLYIFA